MPPLMRLPGYQVPDNALINLTPINSAIDFGVQQKERERQFGLQQEQLGMQRERFGMEKQKFARDQENEIKRRMGNAAVLALLEADQGKRASMHQSLLGLHPNAAGLPDTYRDPGTGLLAIVGDAGMAGEYLQAKLRREEAARMAAAQANQQRMEGERLKLAQGADTRAAETHQAQLQQFKLASPDARAQAAAQYGIQPGTPEYQQFVLQGTLPASKGPDSKTEQAILESDQTAQAARSAIDALTQAKALSAKSYSGLGAGPLGTVTDAVVPWSTPGATNTVQLQQLVTSQALDQLKAVFGAAPTEGERKILLDIQGSVNQSQAAREAIWQRAIDAANQRLALNQQKAAALRGGTYFRPGGAPQLPPSGAPAPAGGVQRSGTPAPDPSKLSDDDLKKALGLP